MSDAIVISETTDRDLDDLMKLWNSGAVMKWVGFPDGLGYGAEQVRRWFARIAAQGGRRHFTVRTADGAFCGELYYEIDSHGRAGLDIKFLPQAQGRGLATQALHHLITLVFEREPGVQAVYVEPRQDNHRARQLYARCGFSPVERPSDLAPADSYWELTRANWTPSRR